MSSILHIFWHTQVQLRSYEGKDRKKSFRERKDRKLQAIKQKSQR